ncbi:MAG: hypothetical protein WBN24_04905 [Acidimicrobiia bacterium]
MDVECSASGRQVEALRRPTAEPIGDLSLLIVACFPAPLRCTYLYDFGDGWTHDIVFCQVVEEEGKSFRKLVAGAQPFPLEDSGGVWGWERCLRIAAHGPRDDEEREIADWLGGWSPESFNLPAARRAFDV